jgi:two-component system, NtrC family, response regulator AtoC
MAETPEDEPDEIPTTAVDEPSAASGLTLRIFGETVFENHPLPSRGEVTLGRSREADIRIEHSSVSRMHARLSIGDTITVEDLGAANGVSIGGHPLKANVPATVAPGEPFDLGSVMVVVQTRDVSRRPRRMWKHGYFEARLEEECARAERGQHSFAVARIGVSGARGNAAEALAAALSPEHVVAEYAPNEFELLLGDVDADEATEQLADVVRQLRELGGRVRTGVAMFPVDGRTPEALVARACHDVWDRTPKGSGPSPVVAAPAMLRLYRLIDRVAPSMVNVLLLGETGVGKEVLAEAVHRRSPRAAKPFLRLNCAAFTETLLESELFGYEKGAFSGAVQTKPGLLETADGGTVFLDEMGEMPASLQAKLLRVIEARTVMRVGGLKERPIDVRFVAATNRDLEHEIERGHFRQDLYYRLNGVAIVIPPLRERREELEELAQVFIARASQEGGLGEPPLLSPAALRLLESYPWPGNIRELRNVIERAVLLCLDGVITPEHLPMDKMMSSFASTDRRPATPRLAATEAPPAGSVADLERQRIIDALEQCAGNQTYAARQLGISRSTMLARLKEFSLPRPRKPRR